MTATAGNTIDLEDRDGKQPIIQAGESCNILGALTNGAAAIEKAAVATLTITLYRESSGEVINSRDDQDILDANGGTLAADGTLTMRLDPADNVAASGTVEGETETHIAKFKWTWSDGVSTRTGIQATRFRVERLQTTA